MLHNKDRPSPWTLLLTKLWGTEHGTSQMGWFLIWKLSSDNLESPGGGKWERWEKCQKKYKTKNPKKTKKTLPHPTITTKEYRETEGAGNGGQEGSLK